MTTKELCALVDHTLLKQTATWQDIQSLCDEAVAFQTASVCIPPCYVAQAHDYLQGRVAVCTVVGFPNGYNSTGSKLHEAQEALASGAKEIDMVINIGMLKQGNERYVLEEIRQMKALCGTSILKVIIETCLLTQEEKVAMCRIVSESGADYIKTSTGFAGAGATFEDITLFKQHVAPEVKIKAAGGITSIEDAMRFVSLGASRLGTSKVVSLLKGEAAKAGY